VVVDSSMLSRALPRRLSRSQSMILDHPIIDEEIQKILLSLKDNKARDSNGFIVSFFKKTWSIVGSDIIRFFFFWSASQAGKCLRRTFIPKVPNPSKVTEFRPISCCNTIYKCIAKLIANRIKGLLLNLVGPFHSTFVAGRNISDNILHDVNLLNMWSNNPHAKTPIPEKTSKIRFDKRVT